MIDEAIIKKDVLSNYRDALAAKEPVNRKINEWLDSYNGKLYGNEQDARSKIIVRDIYKTIESLKPNISEPFISSLRPIDAIPYTASGEQGAISSEKILNYQFTTQLDRRSFYNTLVEILAKEGTVWVKNEWIYEDEEFETDMTVPKEAIGMISDDYEIKRDNGDSYDITVKQIEIIRNEPNLRICRNEHIFVDPSAETDADIQFLIHQYDITMSDLKASGKYKNLDQVSDYRSGRSSNTSLGSLRDTEAYNQGRRVDFSFTDKSRNKVTIMEYWGLYDIDDSGISEPVLIVWDKDSETIIRYEKNPMPDNAIPFERAVYIEEPFTLWGKALADAIDDGQRIHTAFMRGFIDNAALANNGQKFIKKGGIDQMNFRRMVNGEKHIYMNENPNDVMVDGSYNEIPSSVFNVYEMVEQLNEGITGISRINQGLDAGAMSSTATGVSTITSMGQRRMLDTVRNVSNLTKKLLRRQLKYSIFFIDEDEWKRVTGMDKPHGKLGKDFEIMIDLITDAQKQAKIGQFNLMLQNLQYIGEGTRFEVGNMILAKYFELFDEPLIAEAVMNQEPPQPDPMQQQMAQLEMQKLQAEAQDTVASAQLKGAQAQKTMSETQVIGSEAEIRMRELQMQMQELQMQMQIEEEKARQQMVIDQRKSEQQMSIAQQKAGVDMLLKKHKAQVDIAISNEKAKVDIVNKKAIANATQQPKAGSTK